MSSVDFSSVCIQFFPSASFALQNNSNKTHRDSEQGQDVILVSTPFRQSNGDVEVFIGHGSFTLFGVLIEGEKLAQLGFVGGFIRRDSGSEITGGQCIVDAH